MKPRSFAAWAAAALASASLAAALVACGGGVGSGGTGISAGVANGTVNGFGSVIVDGLRFDDRQVEARRENEPGVEVGAEVLLGHRVELGYDAGVATHVVVKATLAGPVASVGPAGQFVVLGQTVHVNADSAAGPVTQFGGGYAGAGSVLAGDAVEVHGVLEGGGLQATRVDRLATPPAYLRVSGLVDALGATGFTVGALAVDTTTASVLPNGAHLANGQRVTLLALPASLTVDAGGALRLAAAQVRIERIAAPGSEATLSGTIAALDATAARFDLGGVVVRYAGATITPAGSTLANGQYVRVRGLVRDDGSLQADSVVRRDGREGAEAELKGNVIGYDAATRTFAVRGVAVDASAARIESCPGGTLAEGLYVAIEGRLGATGVIATSVHCEDEPNGGTVGRKGVASAVDAASSTFTLTPSTGASLVVRWTPQTYFGSVTPQTLNGVRVEIEGTLAGGVLVAQKVKLDD